LNERFVSRLQFHLVAVLLLLLLSLMRGMTGYVVGLTFTSAGDLFFPTAEATACASSAGRSGDRGAAVQ
jgi:hypothetical protein